MACPAEPDVHVLRSAASRHSMPCSFRRFAHFGISSQRPNARRSTNWKSIQENPPVRKAGSRRVKIATELTMELVKVTRSLRWIFVVISRPSKDQFAVIAEDAITQRVRSHISDGKQMLAYSLCFLEIHATANHPVNNHWVIMV
jgi:hypothetical protein